MCAVRLQHCLLKRIVIMMPRVLFVFEVLTAAITVRAGYKGATISCMCSTSQCVEHGMQTCNTTGMCFTQYLDRGDGSQPVIRGCIASKTPLLCENRRPAIAEGSWPVLLCCNSNFCNRDVMPTVPPWSHPEDDDVVAKQNGAADDDERAAAYVVTDRKTLEDLIAKSSYEQDVQDSNSNDEDEENLTSLKKRRKSRHPKIVSPVYITVLVLGVCSLVAIGIVATIMLRRNNRFYSEQYGALEHHHHYHHHHGCKKQRQPSSVTEDESEMLHQAPVLIVYGNKIAGNT